MGDYDTLDRRVFLAFLAAASTMLVPRTASGRDIHYAGIKNTIEPIEGTTDVADNFAACTEMVLRYWGVDMHRRDIASRKYLRCVMWASKDTRRQHWLAEQLSDGLLPQQPGLDITVRSYDRLEALMLHDLRNDHPLIVGNPDGVVVLTDVYYRRNPISISSALVIDPVPSRGRYDLCSVRIVDGKTKRWRWGRSDYYWRNLAYAIRITADPDRRKKGF